MTLRGSLGDGFDDGVALLVFVNKLALIGRANVEFAAVPDDAVFLVVFVAVGQFSNAYFFEFYFHCRR